MQTAQPPFLYLPGATGKLSELAAIFEMVEHHFFWSDGADPSFAHLCHMQSKKYLIGKEQLKDPSTTAELFNQFGSGNTEPGLDQMYGEPVSSVTWLWTWHERRLSKANQMPQAQFAYC